MLPVLSVITTWPAILGGVFTSSAAPAQTQWHTQHPEQLFLALPGPAGNDHRSNSNNDDGGGGSQAQHLSTSKSTFSLHELFHGIQALLTAVAATLATVGLTSDTGTTSCNLGTKWQRMWSAHDARGIRAVQDALACCGFNSVKDRAWPFPSTPSSPAQPTCAENFHRTISCAKPWADALRACEAWELRVVIAVAGLQVRK